MILLHLKWLWRDFLPQTLSIQWRNTVVTNNDFEIWQYFSNIVKHCIADSMTVFNSITLIVRFLIYDFRGIICGIDVFSILYVLLITQLCTVIFKCWVRKMTGFCLRNYCMHVTCSISNGFSLSGFMEFEIKWMKMETKWKPEGRRPLGRPGCGWVANIKMDLRYDGVVWTGLMAQDRDQWRALMNTVINLWLP
jgi:hypothetical protein